MKQLLTALLLTLALLGSASATTVTISSSSQPNANLQGLGSSLTMVVNTSGTTVTRVSGSAIPQAWYDKTYSGFAVTIGSTLYYVSSVDSTSQLTLTATAGTQTGVTMTVWPFCELRAYATASFTPLGASYVVQAGAPGSAQFAKRVCVSQIAGTLYYPQFTLDASVDSQDNQQARYTFGLYRQDGTFIQFYQCYGGSSLRLSTTTPTSLPGICSYNSPGMTLERSQYQSVYTQAQTLTRQEIYALGTGALITGTARRAQGIQASGTGLEDTPISYTTTSASVLGTLDATGYIKPGTGTEAAIAASTGSTGALRKATDGSRGIYAHNGTRWYDLLGYVNPESFGCVGDAVIDANGSYVSGTDNSACFTALNSFINASTGATVYAETGSRRIVFPRGRFYSATVALDISKRVTIEGAGSGIIGGQAWGATELMFGSGVNGLILQSGSDLSTVRNITFRSARAGATSGSDIGIQIRAHGIILDSVGVTGFGQDGLYADCDTGTTSYNCNNWQFKNVVSRNNYRHGGYFYGTDFQAGAMWGGDFSQNGGFGLYLVRSAANTYYSPHFENNGTRRSDGNEHRTHLYIQTVSTNFYNPYFEGWAGTNSYIVYATAADVVYNRIEQGHYGRGTLKHSADGGATLTAFAGNSDIIEQINGRVGSYTLYDQTGPDFNRRYRWTNQSNDALFLSQDNGDTDTKQFLKFTNTHTPTTRNTNNAVTLMADLAPDSNGGNSVDIGSSAAPFDEVFTNRITITRKSGASGVLEMQSGTGGGLRLSTALSTSGGTLNLPDTAGSDTLVGLALTQTLTNKTISGASNTLTNIGNSSLTNSSVTIGSTAVSLGGTAATVAGLTLTTPTIASFTNATHDHTNAAGGGQLNASSVFSTGTVPTARLPVLVGSGTYDPSNMAADGDATSTTLAVTGATTANACTAQLSSIGNNQVVVSCFISAADTAKVVLLNKTGGALDIASGTLKVFVWQF